MYHYAGNNPVKYVDPDGRDVTWKADSDVSENEIQMVKKMADEIMNSDTVAGRRFSYINKTSKFNVTIKISKTGKTVTSAENWDYACNGKGANSTVNFNILDIGNYKDGIKKDLRSSLAHEVSGHSYNFGKETSTYHGGGQGTWKGLALEEQNATAMENEIRSVFGIPQREKYNNVWDVPVYYKKAWYLRPGEFDVRGGYRTISGPASEWRP